MSCMIIQVIRAEVKVTNLIVQHNVPLAVSDHLSPICKEIFEDSEVAQAYGCARTKSMCILNGALAPYFKSELVKRMICSPYCIAIDGSNDAGLSKMNPMTVRFFYEETGTVTTQLLDMCLTSGMLLCAWLLMKIVLPIFRNRMWNSSLHFLENGSNAFNQSNCMG